MSIVLIKHAGAHGFLRGFNEAAATAFERRGHQTIVIDMADCADLGAALEEAAARGPVELAFSFGKLGAFKDGRGRSVGDILGAPHIVQIVDHPLSHSGNLVECDPKTAFLVVDRSHVPAIRSTFPADWFPHIGFSPHAAIGAKAQIEPDPEAFASARPIPILFAGTFYKPGLPGWREISMPANVLPILETGLEMALAVEWMPALDALDAAMRQKGLDPNNPDFASFRWMSCYIHEYVRLHRRFSLLKAVAKAGLPVHLYGVGYESDLYRFKNLTYGGEVSSERILELIRQSRLVLNTNANFGAGSHERPLFALLNGAAAASDHSSFYAEAFEPEEILLYKWQALADGIDEIGRLAADPLRCWRMAQAGQQRVAAHHCWDNRLDAILQAADAVRQRSGGMHAA